MKRTARILFMIKILSVILIAFLLHYSTLNYFFFQDDFFHLNISKADNLGDFLNFFKIREDIIGYRPVTIQLYFSLAESLFGLNSFGFRIVNLGLLIFSFFLIAQVVTLITKSKLTGFLTATLWILSSVHFMAITWISAGYNIIGTFFWLLTGFFFLKFLQDKKIIDYIFSLFSFLLTIGSFEFSVTWPVIFGIYYFYVLKNRLIGSLKVFSPFLIISTIYIFLKFLLTRVPPIPEYQTALNLESVKSLFWYFLWALNIPEEFKKQVINNLLILNPKFFAEYKTLIFQTFLGALVVVTIGVMVPVLRMINLRSGANMRIIVFALLWFIIGISPVAIFPNHTFIMYLTLASIGVYMAVAYLAEGFGKQFLVFPLIFFWAVTSYSTLKFYKNNSWMVEAQRFAREFSVGMIQQLPVLPKNSIVLYHHPDQRHIQALQNSNALQTIYGDASLSIYYNKDTLLVNIDKIGRRSVYIYFPP